MSQGFTEVENNQDICSHCINFQSTRCSIQFGIPHRWKEYSEKGQAACDQKCKTKAVDHGLLYPKVFCVLKVSQFTLEKMKLKVFFHICVFFLTLSRGWLFHHPAGNLHGEGMHTQEYRCLLWELPLVGASLKHSVHVQPLRAWNCHLACIHLFTPEWNYDSVYWTGLTGAVSSPLVPACVQCVLQLVSERKCWIRPQLPPTSSRFNKTMSLWCVFMWLSLQKDTCCIPARKLTVKYKWAPHFALLTVKCENSHVWFE